MEGRGGGEAQGVADQKNLKRQFSAIFGTYGQLLFFKY
jgi:hypothetical protein